MSSDLYKKIKDIVGEDYVTESEFERFFYSRDVSPIPTELQEKWGTVPDIVARPKNAQEVSKIMAVASQNKIPIIPRGGASWWLGGSVPYKGGIVLDLTSMNNLIDMDENNLTITVDCGVTWKEIEDVLERHSYFLGTRPGSAASATVGGWISTGGVGIGSYKYGSVGDLVRSLEVVLPSGEIIQTQNKDLAGHGSGYNLNRLFIGSEGTLGVITKATLKIIPRHEAGPYHVSYAFSELSGCAEAIKKVVSSRLLPHHIAFGDKRHFMFLASMGKPVPDGEIVLCITLEGEKGIIDYGLKKLDEEFTSTGGCMKCCDGKSHEECEECTIEFRGSRINVYPVPGEIFVGLNRFEEALSKIYDLFDEMGLQAGVIGSMVDRRTTMIMPYYIQEQKESGTFMEFHRRLGELALSVGGRRVGLGLFFSSSLSHIHDEGSVAVMRAIKRCIDPGNILNPGKTVGGFDLFASLNDKKG
ncbi:MAG: FAD-binding oxidoreductase [Methanomassiliicoccales archaeon]|nr:MAG: FAD-binding oxidoreductase [Methanomassiliicoccales archaeon]